MESIALKINRTFRPLGVGSFYSIFLSIFIIFVTVFFIQTVSHINISNEDSFNSREDLLKRENEVYIFLASRDIHNDTVFRINENNEHRFINRTFNPTGNISSQYIQAIVRSVTIGRDSEVKTGKGNITNGYEQANNSNDLVFSVDETGSINVSTGNRNETVSKSNTTLLGLKHSLETNKDISAANGMLQRLNIGVKLQPGGNITRLYNLSNGTFINGEQFSRNITRIRKSNVRARNSKRPNYCPLWPEELVGPMQVEQFINRTEIPKANQRWIKEGGRFKPPDCDPRERTAIIIPYRNREKNLHVLLRHLHTVLQRQKIEYGIYVIEMAYPTQFNRGLLANVGFLTASSIAPYTCYVIHDVDLLMTDDRNMYRCGRVPRHLTALNSKYSNKLPYLAYFGGVEAFSPEQYWNVNGFSNLYFGWGGEDDDMVYRIFQTKQHFSRPHQTIGGYFAMEHGKDSSNPQNPNSITLVKSAGKRMAVDGVKSVAYNRLALEFKLFYTWVYIAAKEAKIMEKYQEYLDDS